LGQSPGRLSFASLAEHADTDIQRRLTAHRSGTASRYTRSRRPVELSLVISVIDRSDALREEARIKRLPRAAKLRLIEASSPAWERRAP